jgi:hypothetical protein
MRRLPVFQLLLVAALVFAGGSAFLGVFTAADLLVWLACALVLPLLSLVIRSNWRPHLAGHALACRSSCSSLHIHRWVVRPPAPSR